ncbi:unnamed protein product, partial [Rotaria sordida]
FRTLQNTCSTARYLIDKYNVAPLHAVIWGLLRNYTMCITNLEEKIKIIKIFNEHLHLPFFMKNKFNFVKQIIHGSKSQLDLEIDELTDIVSEAETLICDAMCVLVIKLVELQISTNDVGDFILGFINKVLLNQRPYLKNELDKLCKLIQSTSGPLSNEAKIEILSVKTRELLYGEITDKRIEMLSIQIERCGNKLYIKLHKFIQDLAIFDLEKQAKVLKRIINIFQIFGNLFENIKFQRSEVFYTKELWYKTQILIRKINSCNVVLPSIQTISRSSLLQFYDLLQQLFDTLEQRSGGFAIQHALKKPLITIVTNLESILSKIRGLYNKFRQSDNTDMYQLIQQTLNQFLIVAGWCAVMWKTTVITLKQQTNVYCVDARKNLLSIAQFRVWDIKLAMWKCLPEAIEKLEIAAAAIASDDRIRYDECTKSIRSIRNVLQTESLKNIQRQSMIKQIETHGKCCDWLQRLIYDSSAGHFISLEYALNENFNVFLENFEANEIDSPFSLIWIGLFFTSIAKSVPSRVYVRMINSNLETLQERNDQQFIDCVLEKDDGLDLTFCIDKESIESRIILSITQFNKSKKEANQAVLLCNVDDSFSLLNILSAPFKAVDNKAKMFKQISSIRSEIINEITERWKTSLLDRKLLKRVLLLPMEVSNTIPFVSKEIQNIAQSQKVEIDKKLETQIQLIDSINHLVTVFVNKACLIAMYNDSIDKQHSQSQVEFLSKVVEAICHNWCIELQITNEDNLQLYINEAGELDESSFYKMYDIIDQVKSILKIDDSTINYTNIHTAINVAIEICQNDSKKADKSDPSIRNDRQQSTLDAFKNSLLNKLCEAKKLLEKILVEARQIRPYPILMIELALQKLANIEHWIDILKNRKDLLKTDEEQISILINAVSLTEEKIKNLKSHSKSKLAQLYKIVQRVNDYAQDMNLCQIIEKLHLSDKDNNVDESTIKKLETSRQKLRGLFDLSDEIKILEKTDYLTQLIDESYANWGWWQLLNMSVLWLHSKTPENLEQSQSKKLYAVAATLNDKVAMEFYQRNLISEQRTTFNANEINKLFEIIVHEHSNHVIQLGSQLRKKFNEKLITTTWNDINTACQPIAKKDIEKELNFVNLFRFVEILHNRKRDLDNITSSFPWHASHILQPRLLRCSDLMTWLCPEYLNAISGIVMNEINAELFIQDLETSKPSLTFEQRLDLYEPRFNEPTSKWQSNAYIIRKTIENPTSTNFIISSNQVKLIADFLLNLLIETITISNDSGTKKPPFLSLQHNIPLEIILGLSMANIVIYFYENTVHMEQEKTCVRLPKETLHEANLKLWEELKKTEDEEKGIQTTIHSLDLDIKETRVKIRIDQDLKAAGASGLEEGSEEFKDSILTTKNLDQMISEKLQQISNLYSKVENILQKLENNDPLRIFIDWTLASILEGLICSTTNIKMYDKWQTNFKNDQSYKTAQTYRRIKKFLRETIETAITTDFNVSIVSELLEKSIEMYKIWDTEIVNISHSTCDNHILERFVHMIQRFILQCVVCLTTLAKFYGVTLKDEQEKISDYTKQILLSTNRSQYKWIDSGKESDLLAAIDGLRHQLPQVQAALSSVFISTTTGSLLSPLLLKSDLDQCLFDIGDAVLPSAYLLKNFSEKCLLSFVGHDISQISKVYSKDIVVLIHKMIETTSKIAKIEMSISKVDAAVNVIQHIDILLQFIQTGKELELVGRNARPELPWNVLNRASDIVGREILKSATVATAKTFSANISQAVASSKIIASYVHRNENTPGQQISERDTNGSCKLRYASLRLCDIARRSDYLKQLLCRENELSDLRSESNLQDQFEKLHEAAVILDKTVKTTGCLLVDLMDCFIERESLRCITNNFNNFVEKVTIAMTTELQNEEKAKELVLDTIKLARDFESETQECRLMTTGIIAVKACAGNDQHKPIGNLKVTGIVVYSKVELSEKTIEFGDLVCGSGIHNKILTIKNNGSLQTRVRLGVKCLRECLSGLEVSPTEFIVASKSTSRVSIILRCADQMDELQAELIAVSDGADPQKLPITASIQEPEFRIHLPFANDHLEIGDEINLDVPLDEARLVTFIIKNLSNMDLHAITYIPKEKNIG